MIHESVTITVLPPSAVCAGEGEKEREREGERGEGREGGREGGKGSGVRENKWTNC